MSMDQPKGAFVEIIEASEVDTFIKPNRIRVNGTDVGAFALKSLKIHGGDAGCFGEAVMVTFTLIVDRLEIKREPVDS